MSIHVIFYVECGFSMSIHVIFYVEKDLFDQALSLTLFIWKLERVSGFKLFASIVEIYSRRVL